jgi:hypothetical protein
MASEVDFIEELRLRRWARENYTLPGRREHSWHSVILDEMNRKDAEMASAESVSLCA